MSEKMPPFERPEPRIVGPATPEKKREYAKDILDRFGEHHYDKIPEDTRKILELVEHKKDQSEQTTIKSESFSRPPFYPVFLEGKTMGDAAAVILSIELGYEEIRVNVSVQYEIR